VFTTADTLVVLVPALKPEEEAMRVPVATDDAAMAAPEVLVVPVTPSRLPVTWATA
jgi:hypothetical protein